jgi:hypothetical protein
MLNWVVVVNCGKGGRRGATEKLYGELTTPGPCRPGKSEAKGGPGFGSLKLVKTACGVPGDVLDPPNSITRFLGGLPRFLLNMASILVVIVIEMVSFWAMFHFLVYS